VPDRFDAPVQATPVSSSSCRAPRQSAIISPQTPLTGCSVRQGPRQLRAVRCGCQPAWQPAAPAPPDQATGTWQDPRGPADRSAHASRLIPGSAPRPPGSAPRQQDAVPGRRFHDHEGFQGATHMLRDHGCRRGGAGRRFGCCRVSPPRRRSGALTDGQRKFLAWVDRHRREGPPGQCEWMSRPEICVRYGVWAWAWTEDWHPVQICQCHCHGLEQSENWLPVIDPGSSSCAATMAHRSAISSLVNPVIKYMRGGPFHLS
jgi:hypothetical protein